MGKGYHTISDLPFTEGPSELASVVMENTAAGVGPPQQKELDEELINRRVEEVTKGLMDYGELRDRVREKVGHSMFYDV